MEHSSIRRTVYLGILTGLAMGLHLFEVLIPMPSDLVVPGFKLGLANVVSLYVILNFDLKDATMISVLRTVLGSLLAGTFMTVTFFFSFSGGLTSTLMMGLVYRFCSKRFSLLGISLIGALTHNLTQLCVAAAVIKSAGIFVYLPYMLFFALPTGAFVGLITIQIQKYSNFPQH